MTMSPSDAALHNRIPVFGLLLANVISVIGNMLSLVALPWFVLETTGSAAMTGTVGFFVALPAFVAGVFGGTLVDRFGYKRMSIVSDVFSGVGVAAVPLLHHTTGLAFWQLLVFVFLGALLDVPGLTARRSMIPGLTKLGGFRLEQTNSAFESVQYISLLLGPPLAGVLIAWMGASNVLWINAATFPVSAGVVAIAVPSRPTPAEAASRTRYIDELMSGLRFLRGDRVLFSLAITLAITNFFGSSIFTVLLPVYVQETFGRATVLGLMGAAAGVGALAGSFVYGTIGHRMPRRLIWIVGFMLTPLELWTLTMTSWIPAIVGAMVIGAFVSGPINAMMVTIRHERIPEGLRGRVFSTYSAIAMAAAPVGILLTGYAIETIGLRATIITLAAGLQLVGVAMFVIPAFREMDATRNGQPEPTGTTRVASEGRRN